METFDEIELSIKAVLDSYSSDASEKKFKNDTEWTKVLKERLGELGKEKYKCNICSSGFANVFDPEWLYDLIWYKEIREGENVRLSEVPLVVECEWNMKFNQIKYDFEKLLVTNAAHRLFVCYVHPDNKQMQIDYFRDAVAKYLLARQGDRFLVAILDSYSNEFHYELIVK